MFSLVNQLTNVMYIQWKDIVCCFLIAIVLAALIFGSGVVPTKSMIPTIQMNTRVWYKRIILPQMFSSLRRGDIVIFVPTEEFYRRQRDWEIKLLVKRVIGVPVELLLCMT